jgi:hypothetical protein
VVSVRRSLVEAAAGHRRGIPGHLTTSRHGTAAAVGGETWQDDIPVHDVSTNPRTAHLIRVLATSSRVALRAVNDGRGRVMLVVSLVARVVRRVVVGVWPPEGLPHPRLSAAANAVVTEQHDHAVPPPRTTATTTTSTTTASAAIIITSITIIAPPIIPVPTATIIRSTSVTRRRVTVSLQASGMSTRAITMSIITLKADRPSRGQVSANHAMMVIDVMWRGGVADTAPEVVVVPSVGSARVGSAVAAIRGAHAMQENEANGEPEGPHETPPRRGDVPGAAAAKGAG